MKILLMNHFPLTGSGSGVYTQNIADSLIKKGHDICMIFPENRLVKTGDTKIKYHPVYFKEKEIIEGQLPFNFPCFTTHPRSNQTFYDLTSDEIHSYIEAFKVAIEQEISEFNPDVIHAGHIWILPSIAANYNIPLVVTAHGTDLIGYNQCKTFRPYADKATDFASAIITISEDNTNLVSSIFPTAKEKIKLIPNGYNSDNFFKEDVNKDLFLAEIGISNPYEKIVSFVGKFTHFKGIDILLKAAKIYGRDNTLTILAGDGELFKEMNDMVTDLNLKNIVFLGNQPHELLRKLYNVADVSLIPSRNEAFGLVVIEAMACGAPVIGSNGGGIPDIINDKVGMLFETNNYQELADNVIAILDEKWNYDRLEISKYTGDKYSQDEFVEELVDIYEESSNQKTIKRV